MHECEGSGTKTASGKAVLLEQQYLFFSLGLIAVVIVTGTWLLLPPLGVWPQEAQQELLHFLPRSLDLQREQVARIVHDTTE